MLRHRWAYALALLPLFLSIAMFVRAESDQRTETYHEPRIDYFGDVPLSSLANGSPGKGWIVIRSMNEEHHRGLVVELEKKEVRAPAIARVYSAEHIDRVMMGLIESVDKAENVPVPSVMMESPKGNWIEEGYRNYNLNIRVNGPVYAMWGGGYDSAVGPTSWTAEMEQGEPAVAITVRDTDRDGIPDWDLRQLLPNFPGRGYIRTAYSERMCSTPVRQREGPIADWPFIRFEGGFEQPVGELVPPIVVDPDTFTITHVSELVTARNQNCSYTIYSHKQLEPVVLNQSNFESPFAFYDLSESGTGHPNMILRTEIAQRGDSVSVDREGGRTTLSAPRVAESIRYSWRLDVGDGIWDYKVGVMGFHAYDHETRLASGRLAVNAPDYGRFPGWVLNQTWPAMTFVATESNSYRSSEGIYEWSPRDLGIDYLYGWTDSPELHAFGTLPEGFRGEFRYGTADSVELYFSSVDQRLHLVGAHAGLWDFGGGRKLLLKNVDADAFLDSWILLREDQIEPQAPINRALAASSESLFQLGSYLIYEDTRGVHLATSALPANSYRLQPPRNHEEWQEHRRRFAAGPPELDSKDPIGSILDWHDLHWESIEGASIVDAGLGGAVGEGSLYLELSQAAEVPPTVNYPEQTLHPGRYVLSVADDLRLRRVESLGLRISGIEVAATAEDVVAGRPSALLVRLENSVQWPVREGLVRVEARTAAGDWVEIGLTNVSAPPAGSTTASVAWTPDRAGEWEFRVRAQANYRVSEAGGAIAEEKFVVPVQAPQNDIHTALTEHPLQMMLLFLLAAVGALAGLSFVHDRSDVL